MTGRKRTTKGKTLSLPDDAGQLPDRAGQPVQGGPSGDNLESIGLEAARAVAADPSAPPAARVQAARTLLEYTGKLGRHAAAPDTSDQKPLSSLSRAELEAELARIRR